MCPHSVPLRAQHPSAHSLRPAPLAGSALAQIQLAQELRFAQPALGRLGPELPEKVATLGKGLTRGLQVGVVLHLDAQQPPQPCHAGRPSGLWWRSRQRLFRALRLSYKRSARPPSGLPGAPQGLLRARSMRAPCARLLGFGPGLAWYRRPARRAAQSHSSRGSPGTAGATVSRPRSSGASHAPRPRRRRRRRAPPPRPAMLGSRVPY